MVFFGDIGGGGHSGGFGKNRKELFGYHRTKPWFSGFYESR